MTALLELHVHGLRGIVDASLPFDGGSIVLGGGNGTGKTAFVDAIEFLYTGSVSGLSGTLGLSLRQHGPHLHVPTREVSVSAELAAPSGRVTRWLSGALDVPAQLEPNLREGNRLAFILRRSQLQQFIHAKPADRYRSMAELIGAEDLERTELSLKRARDDLASRLQTLEAQLARADAQLASIPDEHVDERELLTAVNEAMNDLNASEYALSSFEDVEPVRRRVLGSVTRPRLDPRAAARERLRQELAHGVGEDTLRQTVAAYLAQTGSTASTGNRARMLDLLQILKRGRDYLREVETDRCPLCQQEVETRALLGILVRRVSELEEVSLQQQRLDRVRDDLDAAVQDTAGRLRQLERVRHEANVAGDAATPLANAVSMLRESLRAAAPIESAEMATRTETALRRWDAWVEETKETLESPSDPDPDDGTVRANEILALLEGAVARRAESARGRAERLRLQEESERVRREIRHAARALDLASATYATFNRVKNEEIQRIFDELRADLARYYDFLHPGEGHGALAITMDPRKRGSSDLKMDFFERHEEDPRAYGSEGHLDSLGLCIFLAFVTRFNGQWPLLVLDDVVTSVDANHKRRVADLLFREFGDRQLFITTHDARWFNDLRKAQEETGQAARTRNLVAESWTVENGPQLRATA